MPSRFAFCSCQPGAEGTLKLEVGDRLPEWRFAFSRPGFVTFKLPSEYEAGRFEPPRLTFARTMGLSLDRLPKCEDPTEIARRIWAHEGVQRIASTGRPQLHVWRRQTQLPGDDGFEPGPDEQTRALHAALLEQSSGDTDSSNGKSQPSVALDAILVEPDECWIGAHAIRSRTDRWPGGGPRLNPPEEMISRAYLKMQEALRWSALPCSAGELWVELGCSPGGASQALLEAGMLVIGVDPAEVDPALLENERFLHLRSKVAEAPRREILEARWLTADLNVAPDYTLDAVEHLLSDERFRPRGLILTLKLLEWKLAAPELIRGYIDRVRSWGYSDVRTRQLVHNRREFCLVGLKKRAQRRAQRRRKP